MRAMAVVQEEIFTAKRWDIRLHQDLAGKILVGGQRRGGGIVLRIPRASPGTEIKRFAFCGDAEE